MEVAATHFGMGSVLLGVATAIFVWFYAQYLGFNAGWGIPAFAVGLLAGGILGKLRRRGA